MTADGLVEQLGLLGVFIAGAIPWLEAITVIPVGILFGLNPLLTFILAIAGNVITVVFFAYSSGQIMSRNARRRELKRGAGHRTLGENEPDEYLIATGSSE